MSSKGSGNEIIRAELFDDRKTTLDVDISKLKRFSPLKSIPKTRTREWRKCYERALDTVR